MRFNRLHSGSEKRRIGFYALSFCAALLLTIVLPCRLILSFILAMLFAAWLCIFT